MSTHSGEVSAELAVPAEAVFSTITDVSRLPTWNAVITAVIEKPECLEPEAEWVVAIRAMGHSWRSRSRCEVIDTDRGVFAYRTQTDDGNPSYARWRWEVSAHDGASTVRVGFELHPETFWRRLLLARVRARQLVRRELPASLAALAQASAKTVS
jgi:uncharacterized protein YndB with AHSA1/START domain